MSGRPVLSDSLDEAEFRRWYYTMAELQPFARHVGLSAAGPKAELNDRISAFLGGRPIPTKTRKRTNTPQLDGELDRSTVIPNGQRSTAHLRAFFEAEIGTAFRFDGHMRKFLAESNGSTLGDAIDHWHETRGKELPTKPKSLEFNAFTKQWHRHHPNGSATECRAAWDRFRSLPVDERPSVADA